MNKYDVEAKRILEALLFASNAPLTLERAEEILESFRPTSKRTIQRLLLELGQEYENRNTAFQLDEVGDGYLIRTRAIYRPYIEKLRGGKRPGGLSQAALEVLAIIFHKQPATRSQVEAIRGVDSSHTIHNLVELKLLEPIGQAPSVGRPTLYKVTPECSLLFDKVPKPEFKDETAALQGLQAS